MIKPTKEELAIIRQAAKVACQKEGYSLKRIEIGMRYGSEIEDASINILMIDETKDWEESDLFTTVEWKDFKKGIPTDDGRAVVDFYLYDSIGLCTNMQAHFNASKLVWVGIEGPWGFTHWGTEMEYGVER